MATTQEADDARLKRLVEEAKARVRSKDYGLSKKRDPVALLVRNLSAEDTVDWLIGYHGLNPDSRKTVVQNLREQYRWHRLQGQLDRRPLARLIAKVLRTWTSPATLEAPPELTSNSSGGLATDSLQIQLCTRGVHHTGPCNGHRNIGCPKVW